MDAFEKLSPEEAARRLQEEPDKAFFPLPYFLTYFQYALEEIIAEARSGRLVLNGIADDRGGYPDLSIKAKSLREWLAHEGKPAERRAPFFDPGGTEPKNGITNT